MLAVTDLRHVYANGTRALDRVTLSLPAGMFDLLRPNGAGKLTLMRIVSTLQLPTCGSVAFEATDALKEPRALRPLASSSGHRLTLNSTYVSVMRSEGC